ncbi:hypothetical protein EZV73_22170 [Acidaminobacter sp. JC074]|uniref:coiled-coil domain-containing protein n=1 Tax=Acidaminobacter sp. JC074 TaxID=2530199 RepID=UPI001F0D54B2|nr:hypothetical protein [Acidaminobacter sp. JC074]MCH4890305.1 hypothetical protein [Acidaminobacter sp. JC074]
MKSYKLLVFLFCISTLLLGVAYAEWEEEFSILTKVKTYVFDIEVNGQGIDENKKHEAEFTLDDDIELEIKNTGTVGAYINEVAISYENSNDELLIEKMKFEALADDLDLDIRFKGKKLINKPKIYDLSLENGIIEPYDLSNDIYTIRLDKIKDAGDYIEDIEDEIDCIQSQIARLKDKKQAIKDKIAQLESQIAELESQVASLSQPVMIAAQPSENETEQAPIAIIDHTAINEIKWDLAGLYCRVETLKAEKYIINCLLGQANQYLECTENYLEKVVFAYENDTITIETTFSIFND